MHTVLKKLYRDHSHFDRLMNVLEHQLDEFKDAGQPAFDLITELLSYISDYTDSIHHPIEDQLYQTMLARTDKGREQMERLLVDHQVIMNMTREFQGALDALSQGTGISISEAEKKGREYIEKQLSHQQFEEQDAFPLLREELTPEDFHHAAGALPADEDPILDTNMKEHYPALFEHLAQEKT